MNSIKNIIRGIKRRQLPTDNLSGNELSKWFCDDKTRRFEYHEGYYAAGNGVSFDEHQSEAWKEGYRDGFKTIYGDDDLDVEAL